MKIFFWMISVVRAALKTSLLMVTFLLFGCDSQPQEPIQLTGKTMGTYWSIKIAEKMDSAAIKKLQIAIEKRLLDVNQSMSTYIPDSELSQFNKTLTLESYPISEPLAKVIAKALQIGEETEGSYDVTILPIVEMWGFGAKKIDHKPTDEEIKAALENVGFEKLHLTANTLRKEKPALAVDLSSIAKGYGVDEVANVIEASGIKNYLVDIGGEVRAGGKKFAANWTIGVETPDGKTQQNAQVVINLNTEKLALATSGNYRNFIDFDGVRAVHTLNPKTGYPQTSNLLSATIIAENCMIADGYATAVMTLGDKQAEAFIKKYNLAALLIYADGDQFKVVRSAEFIKQFGE